MYGVIEDQPLADAAYTHTDVDYSETVNLDDPRLVSIDRLRLLTEPGCPVLDLSYCYGTLKDGRHVQVWLARHQFSRAAYRREIVGLAIDAHRYAKGLGMLDNLSILWG